MIYWIFYLMMLVAQFSNSIIGKKENEKKSDLKENISFLIEDEQIL